MVTTFHLKTETTFPCEIFFHLKTIEMDIIEKRSIIERISKLEEIVMKYSDI